MGLKLTNQGRTKFILVLIICVLMLWTAMMYKTNYKQDPCAWTMNPTPDMDITGTYTFDGFNLTENQQANCIEDKCDFDGVTLPEICDGSTKYHQNRLFANRVNLIGYILMFVCGGYIVFNMLWHKDKSPYMQFINGIGEWFSSLTDKEEEEETKDESKNKRGV